MDDKALAYSKALISLFKGAIDKETRPQLWETILTTQTQIDAYVSVLGLRLMVNEVDGYCYLQQETTETEQELPRLIQKRQLTYSVSLLLVLLRKALQESDTGSDVGKCILTKTEIMERLRLSLKDTSNEAKQMKNLESNLKHIEEMGFIRKTKHDPNAYEILRMMRSFIDANWLSQLDEKLAEYQSYQESVTVE